MNNTLDVKCKVSPERWNQLLADALEFLEALREGRTDKIDARFRLNKFGVPHRGYCLSLADGSKVRMDVGDESDWGDVQAFMPEDSEDLRMTVGWGNDFDGHVEIVRVLDEETGKYMKPLQWARKKVWCYTENYSS